MQKNNKVNFIVALITYAIALLVFVAMFLPQNVGKVLKINSVAEHTYTAQNVKSKIGCELSNDGKYTIVSSDPQLIIPLKSTTTECIRLNATAQAGRSVNFEIYTALSNGEFSAERCYQGCVFAGQQGAVIDLPKGQYSYLRVDIDSNDIFFKSIETFNKQPYSESFLPDYSVTDYIIVILMPIVLAVVIGLLNKRFKFGERTAEYILKNKIKIATVIIFAIVAALLSVLIELLVGLAVSSGEFNFYRWLIFAAIAEIAVVFVFGYNDLGQKVENLFLPIILILGVVMLFGAPVKHICWDFDSHYPWAVQASYPGATYVTASYKSIDNVEPQTLISKTSNHKEDLEYLSQADEILVAQEKSNVTLAHLPAGVFIAVSRLLGGDFQTKYNMGRLAYLLVYAFACFFAIKKLKSGKMILATICLFPTNLFLATNYAYDWCVTAFCILATAYFISELQQPEKPISVKDTIIMGLAFAVGALPKLVYIVLMGMTLFMRKNWRSKQEKRRYYIIIGIIFAVIMLMFMLRAKSSIGGSGDARGGAVNPSEQMMGILNNPFGYLKMLTKYLCEYLSFGKMKKYISNFAYLGVGKYWLIFALTIIVTAFTDTDGKTVYKMPIYMRVLSIVLYVGMAALIASALYISFTPVGMQTVKGCQARYITPLLAPFILILTGRRFDLIKNKAAYNGCALAALSAGVLLETYSQIIKIMI